MAFKGEEAEVVVPSEPPVVAVGAGDTTIEQVLERGEAGSRSAAASGSAAAHKKQDPANDISYLGFDYEEEVMSEKKWKRVESIDCLKRKIEAKKQELGAVDVAEIFSPPRFTRGASHLGLNAGFAVDLETGWDLDIPEHMKQLKELIEVQDPFMLTGSPRCDPFSVLQNLNKYYLDNAKNREALERGERHLCLSIDLYEERWKKGKYFLHEHAVGAKVVGSSTNGETLEACRSFHCGRAYVCLGHGSGSSQARTRVGVQSNQVRHQLQGGCKVVGQALRKQDWWTFASSHFAHWWIGSSLRQVPGRACVHGPPGHQEPDDC